MIAKRVTRPKGASSFARLSDYLLSETTDRESGVDRLARYILGEQNEGGRVGAVRISNCISDEPAIAVREILATQTLNKRSKGDKTYHLVASFAPGEKPSQSQIDDIETALCDAIGLGAHQRLSAVHTDRAHLHLHIAINKINPITLHAIEPYYDKRRLMTACDELELKHGLVRTNHGLQTPKIGAKRGAAKDTSQDQAAFQTWVAARIEAKALDLLDQSCTWSALSGLFKDNGLELKRRGAGLVIRDSRGFSVRASDINRSFSLKRLTDRLGPFSSPDENNPDMEKRTGRAQSRKLNTARLYAGFIAERDAGVAAKTRIQESFKEDRHRAFTAFSTALRDGKRLGLTAFGRRMRTSELRLERRKRLDFLAAEKRRLEQEADQTYASTWTQYLQRLAQRGDTQALQALRASKTPGAAQAAAFLTALDVKTAATVIFSNLKPTVRRNGSLQYRFSDGGAVTDENLRIRIDKTSSQAVFAALTFGRERFHGQPLTLGGTRAFKAQAVHIAVLFKMDIQFSDVAMENERLHLLTMNTAGTKKAGGVAALPEKSMAHAPSSGYVAREWTPADAGATIYRRMAKRADGGDAMLCERQGLLLTKAINPIEAAMIETWPEGKTIVVARSGKISGRGR